MAASSSTGGAGIFREVKNLEDYLGELKDRSEKRLKELKYERKLMHQKKVNVIAELQKEIYLLKEANKALKLELDNREKDVSNSPECQALKDRIKTLEQEKVWLEQVTSRKDSAIVELQNQIELGSQQHSETSTTGNARELERLALVLKDREHELGEIRKESIRLKGMIEDLGSNHRIQQQDLEDARHEAESLRGIVAELDAQNNEQELLEARHEIEGLKSTIEELRDKGTSWEVTEAQKECMRLNAIIEDMKSEDSARDLMSVKQEVDELRCIIRESREQNAANAKETENIIHSLKVENAELAKQIEHQRYLIKTLSDRKSIDVVRAESSRSDRIPSRPASSEGIPCLNDSEIVQKLHSAYEEIAALYDIRDEILADVQAMRQEIFNPQAIRKIIKVVRDRELAALQKRALHESGSPMQHNKVRDGMEAKVVKERKLLAQVSGDMEALKDNYEHRMKIMEMESEGLEKHLKEKWKSEYERRRQLHNTVLELKGNIRVFCRIRPLLPCEEEYNGPSVLSKDPETLEIITRDGLKEVERSYEFDRVFSPDEGQQVVFNEVSGLVTSVLDGYNVCIMAYGQTGSGKTHTMDGPVSDPGVNTRSLHELFKITDCYKDRGQYVIKASVLEIYNEQIIDLLSDKRDQKLDIKQDANGMYVPGLIIKEVHNLEDVANLVQTGKKNRSTFATNMNVACTVAGKLHLIDLAGSERLSRSGAEGDRLKEAQSINKSLSALGDVIQALRQKRQHIPFRNSKLTRFLEDSLGRGNKCLLVANFSPAAASSTESRCSADFASRVKKVELGRGMSLSSSQGHTKKSGLTK